MDDVTLTFDPNSFMAAMDKINGSLDKMNNHFDKFGKEGTKSIKRAEFSTINLTRAFAPLIVAVGAFRSMLRTIPEIGRTFSIAGDIFMRNFLWPLRKELVPLLQKLLDWVRDNRAMFVRWGSVVANIFRVIKSIIVGIWDTLKRLWEVIASRLEQIFGKTTNSVTEMANLILFKISLIAEFIIAIFENVAEFMIEIWANILAAAKGFFEGMMVGIGDLGPELDQLIKWFRELFNLISSTDKESGLLVKTFKTLGVIIGSVVGTAIRGLVDIIDDLLTNLSKVPVALDLFKAWRDDDIKGMERHKRKLEKIQSERDARIRSSNERQINTWKASSAELQKIFSGTSSQITNVNNRSRTNTTNTTNNNNIKIEVKGSDQPKAVADEVSRQLRYQLRDDKVRGGR